MNIKEFSRKLEGLCAAHKVSVDTGLKFGNSYLDMVLDKSDTDVRDAAKHQLDLFFAEHGVEDDPDIRILADICGLKNTNSDRQWLRHQVNQRRLTYKPTAEAAD
jgi:hypothetical protein